MNKKNPGWMGAFILIAGVGLFYWHSKIEKTGQLLRTSEQQSDLKLINSKLPSHIGGSSSSTITERAKIKKKELSPEQRSIFMSAMEDAKRWMLNRGYYEEHDLADYQSYSEENLMNLARDGDMKALWILANKRYDDKKFTEAAQLYRSCAIRGSIPSLQKLSELSFIHYSEQIRLKKEDAYSVGLEVGVWNLLARKRGHSALEDFFHISVPDYPVIKFKGIDYAQVIKDTNIKTDQYYTELESARKEAGLGSFDNSITNSWKIIKDTEENYYDPLIPASDERGISEVYWR